MADKKSELIALNKLYKERNQLEDQYGKKYLKNKEAAKKINEQLFTLEQKILDLEHKTADELDKTVSLTKKWL